MAWVERFRGKWRMGWKGLDGRQRYKMLKGATTKAEAKRIAREWEGKLDRAQLGLEQLDPNVRGWTLGELGNWWLREYSEGGPSHVKNESTIRVHVLSNTIASQRLEHVTPERIERFFHEIGKKASASTVNRVRGFLHTWFGRAIDVGYWAGQNPVAKTRARKRSKKQPEYLRRHEVGPFLRELPKRWRGFFAVMVYAGLRKGEVIGLRVQDVDLDEGWIHVRRSYSRDTTKGGHEDAVPIPRGLAPHLEAAVRAASGELLFPSTKGEMMSPDVKTGKVIEAACRKAGVRRVTTHGLRHTFIANQLAAGASLAQAQALARHSDPRLTTNTYGHLESSEALKQQAERVSYEEDAEVVDLEKVRKAKAG